MPGLINLPTGYVGDWRNRPGVIIPSGYATLKPPAERLREGKPRLLLLPELTVIPAVQPRGWPSMVWLVSDIY